MISDIKAKVNQVSPTILTDGDMEYPAQSKLGQLFIADWKTRLLLAGKLWRYSVGTVVGAGGISGVTGGGAGTTIDADEPEIAIAVPAGYYMIPVEIMVAAMSDIDADAELIQILATIDRSQVPAGVTAATNPIMYNLLDGAGSFPGTSYGEVTVVTTDPTNEEILDYCHARGSDFIPAATAAAGSAALVAELKMHYQPQVPSIVAGPCTLLVYWGGTAATTAIATVVVGVVPTSWFPVS